MNARNYRHRSGLCTLQARSGVRLEKRADGKQMIRGYAAVFYDESSPEGTEYWLYSDIVERIAPGAFDRAVKDRHDARGLFNHDMNLLLGRLSSGNLRFGVDRTGLWYEVDEDSKDPDWQRVAAKIDRSDVTGSSFGFRPTRTTWTETPEYWIRTIEDLDLYDVSPVTWPAYSGTSAGRGSGAMVTHRDFESDQDDQFRATLLHERNLALGDDLPRINARLAELGLDRV